MPRKSSSAIPQIKRKAEQGRPDRAYVWLDGKRYYLGSYGSASSLSKYRSLIAQWLDNDGKLPEEPTVAVELTISELIAEYWKHCLTYYTKRGKPTDEQACIRAALKPVNELFGNLSISAFTAPLLVRVQKRYVEMGLSRSYANKSLSRVKRCFNWGVKEGIVDGATAYALKTVDGLKYGRTTARESEGVKPVDAELLEATLKIAPEGLKRMIRFQILTACRPGELCSMTSSDIDRSKAVWIYKPSSHKTEHQNKGRTIYINQTAQAIIGGLMENRFIFEANGKPFETRSYRDWIHEVCEDAELEPWNPNQLRHNAATSLRAMFGLEATAIILGHSKLETSQIYAERDEAKALEAVRLYAG